MGSDRDHSNVTYPEEGVIKVKHLRTHEVLSTNSTENNNVSPDSLITENTYTAVCVEASESLRDLLQKN
jgi:hypothetical protein